MYWAALGAIGAGILLSMSLGPSIPDTNPNPNDSQEQQKADERQQKESERIQRKKDARDCVRKNGTILLMIQADLLLVDIMTGTTI